MSVIFKEVENPNNCKPGHFHGPAGIISVSIDPKTTDQLPFPSDYKYFSSLWPRKYIQYADRIQNFKVRPDDIWVLGSMKTGTTWMQNILIQLNCGFDFTANFVPPHFNYFEAPVIFDKANDDEDLKKFATIKEKTYDFLDAVESPRYIKSHLPAYLLPKEIWKVRPKMVYMSRDAKDVAVSSYHMIRNIVGGYPATKSDYYQSFHNDYVVFAPFYKHIHSYHQLRHLDHLLCMTYEDLSTNTFACIKRVSKFLGRSYSDEQLHRLIEHVSFGKMQEKVIFFNENRENFKFCRKGKVGGYRDEMSEEEIKQFDEWKAEQLKQL